MKTILTTLIVLTFSTSFGQKWVDLANVYWRTSPVNSIEGSNDTRNFNTYAIDLKAPIVLNDNNVLLIGLGYQHNTINSQTSNSLLDFDFKSAQLQIGWEHKWNEKSKMLFMSITRLNSDFKNIGLSHFQQGGLALGTTSRSDKFDWKYGVYANADFFGPIVVPLFGFNWKINEKWRFKMVIPVNLELSYMPKDWFITGLRFDGVNASYRSQIISGGLPGQNDTYIDKADNNAWAFAEFHLGKNIWFHVKAGYSVLRKYRVYDGSETMNLKLGPVNIGDNRPSNISAMENGMSFEARFIYRLPLD
ncbi:MAG: hypothetical protein ACI857_002949 [Arenicella sp.]|jgi:hypothetical protein